MDQTHSMFYFYSPLRVLEAIGLIMICRIVLSYPMDTSFSDIFVDDILTLILRCVASYNAQPTVHNTFDFMLI